MSAPVRISEAATLALHASFWLASSPGEYNPTRKICDDLQCSQAHLAKVVQSLARAKLVESLRGPSGGVRLASPASEITLLDIYKAIEGETSLMPGCLLPPSICPGRACTLGNAIYSLNRQFVEMLGSTTLETIRQEFEKSR